MLNPKLFLTSLLLGLATSQPSMAERVPWHLESPMTSAEASPVAINVWGMVPGPHKVVVAVIDSGVIQSHPSLSGQLLPGYTMLSHANDVGGGRGGSPESAPRNEKCGNQLVSDSYRTHGTEVASLIAGNGKMGVWGVNPNAKIVPVRLMGPCPMTRRDMMDAIAWSAGLKVPGVPINPNPARIINMSFSGGSNVCSPQLQILVNQLVGNGVFLVAAAGNNFQKKLREPANCRGVISVGSLMADQKVASYSALDNRTSLYAPGGGPKLSISQAWSVNKLRVATEEIGATGGARLIGDERGVGTSFAAPIVSGYIALMLSSKPEASPVEVLSAIDQFTKVVVRGVNRCTDCLIKQLFVSRSDAGS